MQFEFEGLDFRFKASLNYDDAVNYSFDVEALDSGI